MAKQKLKKSEKRLLIGLGVVAVISGIILYDIYGPKTSSKPEIISQSTPETTTETSSSSSSRSGGGGSRSGGGGSRSGGSSTNTVSIDDIEKHNRPNDCWTTIGGEAYDITGFIQEYQSIDQSIENYCGTYGFEIGFLEENPQLRDFILQNSSKV